MYLTYEEYVNLGGTLSETAFNYLEYEASVYIDWITYNRLHGEDDIPEAVKQCEYHIIQLVKNKLELMNVTPDSSEATSQTSHSIASESNDGVSVSYNVLSAKEILDSSNKEIDDIVNRYLQGIRNSLGYRLLFKGIYPDEVVR